MNATDAIVDATLLHGSELWALLAEGRAARIEVVHTRWLRKAAGEFRVLEDGRLTDAEVRSTHSLIASRRHAYLSSLGRSSHF